MTTDKNIEDLAYEEAIEAAIAQYEKYPGGASYAYDKAVLTAIHKHIPEPSRECHERLCARGRKESEYDFKIAPRTPRQMAAWAIGGVCCVSAAYMTPGFAKAKQYHDIYGS